VEARIRTEKHPNSGVVIWVVADDEALGRSVKGAKGRSYRDLAMGVAAMVEFAGGWLAVQAISAPDPAAIAWASREYLRKYQPSPHASAMRRSGIPPLPLGRPVLWVVPELPSPPPGRL
jgi:hypothetical protein